MSTRISALLLAALLVSPGMTRAAQKEDPFAPANKAPSTPAQKKKPADGLLDTTELLEPALAAPGPRGIDARIHFDVSVEPKTVRRGETIKVTIAGVLMPGFHTYPLTQRANNPEQDELQLSKLVLANSPGLQRLWPVQENPAPEFVREQPLGWFLEHKRPFTWSQDILVLPDAQPGPRTLHLTVEVLVCNERDCLPGKQEFDVPFTIADGSAVALSPEIQDRQKLNQPPIEIKALPGTPPVLGADSPQTSGGTGSGSKTGTESEVKNETKGSTGSFADLLNFIWLGICWGAISLVTPCVFPMIPITVSYFIKQSERQHHRPLTMALVYSLTIVIVLTLGGVLLMRVLQPFSQHWATNLVLGLLFGAFALSLFGMFEIRLPSSLANLTSAREGKGGLEGTVFMALTFTIISFTCVAPFYGSFIALSASTHSVSSWEKLQSVLGALAYSVTFASPFFFLALFPNLLRSLPKSGSWMNTVKVVMGFLELAAALKFLRAGELVYNGEAQFLTYDLVLGLYVALSILCGLYLLGLFRLPHDDAPAEHLGVPRLLFSLAFLGLGLYLMPALFRYGGGEKQRPTGKVFAWLDSFLLPDLTDEAGMASDSGNGGKPAHQLAWLGDLKKGLAEAEAKQKLVFVDFTGLT
jgi:thiol:disulfide interchange protein DsbD